MIVQSLVMAEEDQTKVFADEAQGGGLKPPYLVIVDGPHKGARFPLKSDQSNSIGRLEECHVILDDQSVSRKHAELKLDGQRWQVKDLQSKNGTAVNGSLIQEPVVLGHKDLLRFGIYTLRLVTQELSPQEEMEVPADVGEWGTVMVGEGGGAEGETRQLGAIKEVSEEEAASGKIVTAPHSPLEEEGGRSLSLLKKKMSGLPTPRLWVLGGILFAVALAVGLYFYWETVLSPNDEVAKKAKPVSQTTKPELSAIPLGPPAPEVPKTVPVFLDCVANPFPATVSFAGKEIGKTPLKVNVDLIPDKDYEIEARFEMSEIQENYSDHVHFQVKADQSMLPILFHAPVGTLKIVELPRDASLYLEAYFAYNKFQAKTVKLQNIVLNKPVYAPFGRYILELRKLKAVGNPPNMIEDIVYRREFNLEEDSPTFAVDVLEEGLDLFPAVVRSEPRGADVFVDQKKVGTTPYEGKLPVGKHTLTLRKEGYFESSQEIEASINTPFATEVTLKTSAAGEKINQARSFVRQGVNENALQSLSEVFGLNPSEGEIAETRAMLGNVYLAMGDLEKAAGYFSQASQNEKYKYWGKLGLSKVYAAQNNIPQSLVPLVDVLLNAKEEEIQTEAHGVLRQISPLRSVVYIQSDPQGAAVYLNDKKLAQATPLLLHEMGLGAYRIRLEKKGYQPLDLNINLSINEFNPVLSKLKPLPE